MDTVALVAHASVLETSRFAITAPPVLVGPGKAPGRVQPVIVSATKVAKSKADQVVVNSLFKASKTGARTGGKKVVVTPAISGVVPVPAVKVVGRR